MTKIIVRNDQGYKAYHNGGIYWKLCTAPSTPPVPPGPETEPFYIESWWTASDVSIKKNSSSAPTIPVEYSFDKTTWQSLGSTSTTALTINVPANSKVWLRASTSAWATSASKYNYITVTRSCNVGGNIMSLLYGSNFTGNETTFPGGTCNFCGLFMESYYIMDASKLILPATTLTSSCYRQMFRGCWKMTKAPELPATTLADYCYLGMFRGCSALTTIPTTLPATTLANYCYQEMFYECSALTAAPDIRATTITFGSCREMFQNCTALTTAPDLLCETLASYCYTNMFNGCTKLNYIRCLATDISASGCLTNWVSSVASSGTFTKKAGISYPSGASGIPSGWTVVEE